MPVVLTHDVWSSLDLQDRVDLNDYFHNVTSWLREVTPDDNLQIICFQDISAPCIECQVPLLKDEMFFGRTYISTEGNYVPHLSTLRCFDCVEALYQAEQSDTRMGRLEPFRVPAVEGA